jgi:hypothetical protein
MDDMKMAEVKLAAAKLKAVEATITLLGGLGSLVLSILMIPVGLTLDGWVFSKMWNWLIVPLVHFEITIPQAIGLSMFVYAITFRLSDLGTKDKGFWGFFLKKVLFRLIFLLEAYCLYHWFY